MLLWTLPSYKMHWSSCIPTTTSSRGVYTRSSTVPCWNHLKALHLQQTLCNSQRSLPRCNPLSPFSQFWITDKLLHPLDNHAGKCWGSGKDFLLMKLRRSDNRTPNTGANTRAITRKDAGVQIEREGKRKITKPAYLWDYVWSLGYTKLVEGMLLGSLGLLLEDKHNRICYL